MMKKLIKSIYYLIWLFEINNVEFHSILKGINAILERRVISIILFVVMNNY